MADRGRGPPLPAAKVVTVSAHLSETESLPTFDQGRLDRNAVLYHRSRKFAEVGSKPGHGDAASQAARVPNLSASEVKAMLTKTSVALSTDWLLDGKERQHLHNGPLGTK